MTHIPDPPGERTRHVTVAVFVVAHGHVLLHPHRKLGLWLPPGGHLEEHELPDDAAVRETLEETGLDVHLVGSAGLDHHEPGSPRQLVRPEGIQLEDISATHQHIDLIYYAAPDDLSPASLPQVSDTDGMEWVDEQGLLSRPVTEEVRAWARQALAEVPRREAQG